MSIPCGIMPIGARNGHFRAFWCGLIRDLVAESPPVKETPHNMVQHTLNYGDIFKILNFFLIFLTVNRRFWPSQRPVAYRKQYVRVAAAYSSLHAKNQLMSCFLERVRDVLLSVNFSIF